MNLTFIHAADLHLDAALPPPAGLAAPAESGARGRKSGQASAVEAASGGASLSGADVSAQAGLPELPVLLRDAPLLALHRLVRLCIESKASFLLLSGDVFDGSSGSLKARLELRDAFNRLGEHGIQVFWARGNHDPLPSGGGKQREVWPDNLHIFDVSGQSFALPWNGTGLGKPVALEDLCRKPDMTAGAAHAGPHPDSLQGSLFGNALPEPGRVSSSDSSDNSSGDSFGPDDAQPAAALSGTTQPVDTLPATTYPAGTPSTVGTALQTAASADFSRGAVLVHGISHDGPSVHENLASRLMQGAAARLAELGDILPPARRFQAGVLHCAVGGGSGAHENYAPCLLGDLQEAGVDYWALGHIHLPSVLSTRPFTAYSGSLQGLHVREHGPRGCRLCRVQNGRLESSDFVPLAPVRWEQLEISLSPDNSAVAAGLAPDADYAARQSRSDRVDYADSTDGANRASGTGGADGPEAGGIAEAISIEELDEFLLGRIEEALAAISAEHNSDIRAGAREQAKGESGAEAGFGGGYAPQAVLFRLRLTGRSHLDSELRREKNLDVLLERLNRALSGGLPWSRGGAAPIARVKDIKLDTRPDLDLAGLLAGDNLVAESLRGVLRLAATARSSQGQALADSADVTGFDGELPASTASSDDDAALLDYYREPLGLLHKHPLLRHSGGEILPLPEDAGLAELATEAAILCLDMFEVER